MTPKPATRDDDGLREGAAGRDVGRQPDFGSIYWRQAPDAQGLVGSLEAGDIDDGTFRMLADTIPTLCWVANGDGFIVWYNRRWHEYCGTTDEQMAGWGWQSVHDPAVLPQVMAQWTASIRSGEAFEMTFPLRGADGAFRPFLTRIQPVRDESGAVVRWFGVNTDVSAQHAAEDALRLLNETLETQVRKRTRERDRAWQLSQDLLAVADRKGRLIAINRAWSTLLGWEARELLGKAFAAFTHPDDLAATMTVFGSIFEIPLVEPFEFRLRHKDESYRWFAWTAAFEAGGAEGGMIYATGRDTSAAHDKAEALAQAEEALRQAQKMEAVGQLTGGLAHDFNNLLTGISGSLELLQTRVSQGRTADLDRYVSAAQGAAKRAAALTHRLLAFSRRQTLAPRPTQVNRLVGGMEDLVRRTVGAAIELEVVAAGGLWNTLIDPNQLENALLNLCINARDAMPDGGRLTIETANRWIDARTGRERELAPGQYVSLCVTDTGTGMTAEVVARAFDPFFTTKPLGMGTGLGMSMIYGFVRQSGGQARIYSEPGEGTMVCLYLPRHGGELDPEPVVQPPVPERTGRGETVLVVDDEPLVRMLVTEVVEDMGFVALEATDGATALQVLQSDVRVDLVVTDVGLPGGMNGRQMADAARAGRPGLQVLFITGYAENALIGNGQLEAGMHVLTKPFELETLRTQILELVEAGTFGATA